MKSAANAWDRPLSNEEWAVVDMARKDGPRSANPDGPLARLMETLFGICIARPLASERLETLRRFAVRVWYWDLVRTRDISALIDAGFSARNARQVLAYVATFRGFSPSVQDCLV